MPILRIETGSGADRIIDLGNDNLVIGREASCALALADPEVAAEHAEIFCVARRYFIRDLESRTGTFLNGDRMVEEMLRFGDRVRVGGTVLSFEEAAPADRMEGAGYSAVSFVPEGDDTLTHLVEYSPTARGTGTPGVFRRHLEWLALLLEVRKTAAGDQETLIQEVLSMTARLLMGGTLFLFTGEGKEGLRLSASFGQLPEPIPVSRAALRQVLRGGKAMMFRQAEPKVSKYQKTSLDPGTTALCVPVPGAKGVAGVLYLQRKEKAEQCRPDELEFAVLAGMELGLACETILFG